MTNYQPKNKFAVLKKLGNGACGTVLLTQGENDNVNAMKILDLNAPQIDTVSIRREAEIQSKLNHPNIVKCYGFSLNSSNSVFDLNPLMTAQAEQETNKQRNQYQLRLPENCAYMQLEYCEGGEFFDFVQQHRFPAKYCRFFFKQMLDGLEHIHEAGFSHRDVKLENLLFDKAYNIKIADFGFASYTQQRLFTKQGTERYMAPEVQEVDRGDGKPYSGPEVDLFALGVILFIMYTGVPPFVMATRTDQFYKLFFMKAVHQFWRWHSVGKSEDYFDEDFKDLISKMLAFKPSDRLTLQQVKQHAWLQGQTADSNTVQYRFSIRADMLKQQETSGINSFTDKHFEEEANSEECFEGGNIDQQDIFESQSIHQLEANEDVHMELEDEIAAPCAQVESASEQDDIEMLTDNVEIPHHIILDHQVNPYGGLLFSNHAPLVGNCERASSQDLTDKNLLQLPQIDGISDQQIDRQGCQLENQSTQGNMTRASRFSKASQWNKIEGKYRQSYQIGKGKSKSRFSQQKGRFCKLASQKQAYALLNSERPRTYSK